MPTKTSKTLAKQQQQHFKWYYAIILIGVVAVLGILIIRFSNASTATFRVWTGADSEWTSSEPLNRAIDNNLPAGNKTVLTNSNIIPRTGIKNDWLTLTNKQYIQACAYVKAPAGVEVWVSIRRGDYVNAIQSTNSGSQYGYTKYCSETKPSDSVTTAQPYGYVISTPLGVGSYSIWKLERNILTSTK